LIEKRVPLPPFSSDARSRAVSNTVIKVHSFLSTSSLRLAAYPPLKTCDISPTSCSTDLLSSRAIIGAARGTTEDEEEEGEEEEEGKESWTGSKRSFRIHRSACPK